MRRLIVVLSALLLLSANGTAWGQVQYNVIDLGNVGASGINSSGQIIGTYSSRSFSVQQRNDDRYWHFERPQLHGQRHQCQWASGGLFGCQYDLRATLRPLRFSLPRWDDDESGHPPRRPGKLCLWHQ